MSGDLYGTKEAAEYLGINLWLVGRYCRQGRIRAEKVGSRWLIERAELERFAAIPRRPGKPKRKEQPDA